MTEKKKVLSKVEGSKYWLPSPGWMGMTAAQKLWRAPCAMPAWK